MTEVRTEPDLHTVGKAIPGHDVRQKVQGALAYADDRTFPGMLHGKVVRSLVPSARIRSIDVADALSVTGVHAVLTAADVPSNCVREEASGFGLEPVDMPVLADGVVRYQGEPVALVAAETPEGAEEAAELVVVDYEELPGVFDPEAALAEGAPNVHPGGNLLVEWRFADGDVEEGLRSSAHVVEGKYRTQRVDHAYLEPEGGVGWFDADGTLTLRVSTQVIEHVRQVARILDLPASRVRVIGSYMGGGFGGKEDMTVEPFIALLVWRTGRPVRMAWSRQESLAARPKRHPFVMRYRTGVDADGRIVAQDVRIVGDGGAYPLLSARVLFAAGVTACGPYRVPNVRVEAVAAFTNNVPASAFRGFGAMQVVLGHESQMDRIAEVVRLSREEVRVRNFLRQGDPRPTGEEVETAVAAEACMRAALDALREPDAPQDPGRPELRRGVGFACNMQPYGRARYFADRASCWIGLERDGSLQVRSGVTDLGGGQAASLAHIAGEVFGVHPSRIAVHIADSALTPLAGGTFATRQLYMSGNAALLAAGELRELLAPVAADLLDAPVDRLVFADERVGAEDGESLSLAELARAAEDRGVPTQHLATFHAETGPFDPRTGKGMTFPDYTYGCHAAEVEVDTETGVVRVVRYAACHDVGRAIDPLRVEGQIHGGAVQGIGYALLEEVVSDEGMAASSLFADYLIPVATDVPDIEAIALEIGPGKGPFGARGIGEPSIAPPAAAIANAVTDALGVRVTQLPITPERVLEALRQAGSAGSAEGS